MRAKFINEKFEEDSDPIKDLGIGLWGVREFDTFVEAAKFFVDAIQHLSKGMFTSREELKQYIIDMHNKKWYTGNKSLLRACKNYLDGFNGLYPPIYIKEMSDQYNKSSSKLIYIKELRDAVKNETKAREDSMYESLNEKFEEDSDPIYDLGIGIPYVFPDICKSILENDDLKLFFTVVYNKTALYTDNKSKSYFFHIYLNMPRTASFPDYCSNESLKEYVEDILFKKLNYKNIFIDVHLLGNFRHRFPDIDTDEKILSKTPTIYCDINFSIKEHIKENHIKVQRDHDNLNKLKIEIK